MNKRKTTTFSLFAMFSLWTLTQSAMAQTTSTPQEVQSIAQAGPDGKLQVLVNCSAEGKAFYSVTYNGKTILDASPLGLDANIGNYKQALQWQGHNTRNIDTCYTQSRIKQSEIHYVANELNCDFINDKGQKMTVTFRISNNDVAFRYTLAKPEGIGSVVINEEVTGFDFPTATTTFLCPQSDAMIGWKRTKPSYEEEYTAEAPMSVRSKYGHGYTFPCLFHINNAESNSLSQTTNAASKKKANNQTIQDAWVLISETGVDSHYCGSHLSDMCGDGLYTVAFPMAEENNGNGTVEPALALPGSTPWRTITVGETLQPIVETTIPWDVVNPLYETEHDYQMGHGVWSWILWQDNSINYNDQVKYIDFAHAMGYEYILIDNWWDKNIGQKKMEELVKYAQSKNVNVFLWYSSSGYWNDIEQGPINMMDNPIVRKQQMKWMESIGVKGIKVDFFGGDKQETMRLYESILSDADDYGLMVIFHGCTLPRGWERMYPNYVGSEAVLASENLIFDQHFCDEEAFNTCLHPFIRNAVGCMEFGGCFMNKRMNSSNNGGKIRRTGDVFELATTVLFQNPIQNFALAPNNLTDAPAYCMEFLKNIPTTWDETRFIDGYPGKYVVLARRHGEQWYIAAVNATKEAIKLKVELPMVAGKNVLMYKDEASTDAKDNKKGKIAAKEQQPETMKIKGNGIVSFKIESQGGTIIVTE